VTSDVVIIGVGCTPFGRHLDLGSGEMARVAVRDALADAGVTIDSVGAAFYATVSERALEGQHMIPGQVALRPAGLTGAPVVNVENACAGGATALWSAIAHVRAGMSPVALAVGVDKLVTADPAAGLAVFDGALDVHDRDATLARLLSLAGPQVAEPTGRRSVFMEIYAALARAHMNRFGTTAEDLATVAAKNHVHSVHSDRAQFRRAFSVSEVIAARMVAEPLTVPMCSPVSDGAAAVLVADARYAARLEGSARHIRLLSCALISGSDRDPDDVNAHIGRRAALAAYEQAGVGPEDVDVAEVHDATAFGEIQQTENLGFCGIGDGGAWARSGASTLGGTLPVNPSGGLESRGHPVSATGLAQIFELVTQLRSEAGPRQVPGARLAVAENGGGLIGVEEAVAAVTVLESSRP